MAALTQPPNALGVPVQRATLRFAATIAELQRVYDEFADSDRVVRILGDATNVVLLPDIDAVLCYLRLRGLRIVAMDQDTAVVEAAAGEVWHELVRWSVAQGFSGLEPLALIPGRVGAAPVQNIGAYGVELVELFESADVLDSVDNSIATWDAERCGFGYRDSRFKTASPGRYVVLSLRLRLFRRFHAPLHYPDVARELARRGSTTPRGAQLMEAIIAIRRRKLPDIRRFGNVGSFFKNPIVDLAQLQKLEKQEPGWVQFPAGQPQRSKLAAAQLIDRAGFKGVSFGPVGAWPRQPLVLFNRGGADGRDFLAAASVIQQGVMTRYGVALEMEPGIIG